MGLSFVSSKNKKGFYHLYNTEVKREDGVKIPSKASFVRAGHPLLSMLRRGKNRIKSLVDTAHKKPEVGKKRKNFWRPQKRNYYTSGSS